MQKSSWVFLHLLLIGFVLVSLFTGFRIAVLQYDWLLAIDALLPQGELHSIHFIAASGLLAISVAYLFYRLLFSQKKQNQRPNNVKRSFSVTYHRWVEQAGYYLLCAMILTGLFLFLGMDYGGMVLALHFYLALLIVVYIVLHAWVHIVQFGMTTIRKITQFKWRVQSSKNLMVLCAFLAVFAMSSFVLVYKSTHELYIKKIAIEQFVEIDGVLNEAMWNDAPQLSLMTLGGANFDDSVHGAGSSKVSVRAIANEVEAYFAIQWEDKSKSLEHLPLLKTEQGWKVQHQGFDKFDETQYYEDKFAVILSDSCDLAAAGTAHLGPKPLKDRPANWSGKGYHYVDSAHKQVVDMWQWKAIRSNRMILADDNHIGAAKPAQAGSRRYTAGYYPDVKSSSGYKMNWKWFSSDTVTPKRLPKDDVFLAPYQSQQATTHNSWVIPWFSFEPYSKEKDTYAIGTKMPSVLYRTNRTEGDRADVRAFGRWEAGVWTLELVRKLDTGSKNDVVIQDNICMWFAAFDHAQIRHTRHQRPVKVRMEP